MGEVSGRGFRDQAEPDDRRSVDDTLMVAGRHDLTDAQWAVLDGLLPTTKKTGRPIGDNHAAVVNGQDEVLSGGLESSR
jgi:hypothetical protein